MKNPLCWSLLVCACAGLAARGDEAADAKSDGKKMQGAWQPVSAALSTVAATGVASAAGQYKAVTFGTTASQNRGQL